MTEKVKSDGGSSDYYKIKIPKHIVKDLGDHYQIETGDVIRYAFDDNFAIGNIIKALKRLGKKDGTDIEYDVNKIKYFLDDYVRAYYSEPSKPETKPGKWIEHDGDGFPRSLSPKLKIEVQYANGGCDKGFADYWNVSWYDNIKRYRVL